MPDSDRGSYGEASRSRLSANGGLTDQGGAGDQQPQGAHSDTRPEPPTSGGGTAPPEPPQPPPEGNPPGGGEETPSERHFWDDLNLREWITAGATVAAALAAIAGVVIAVLTYGALDKQRVIMGGQLDEMKSAESGASATLSAAESAAAAAMDNATAAHDQAASMSSIASLQSGQLSALHASVAAAQNAAEQARVANSISKEAVVAVQRAFITVNELNTVHVKGLKPIGGSVIDYWSFNPVALNSGSTPSRDLIYSPIMGLNFFDLNIPVGIGGRTNLAWPVWTPVTDTPVDPIEASDRTPRTRMLLSGHQSYELGVSEVTPEYLHAMQAKGQKMYVFGYIRYRDIFPGTPEHITKYCFVVSGLSDPALGESKPDIGRCLHWNCADNECDADRREFDDAAKGPPQLGVPPRPGPIVAGSGSQP